MHQPAPPAAHDARLGDLLARAARDNPFQRARLRDAGGRLGAVEPMGKLDLIADQRAHPPFGSNLTFPLRAYTRVHETTGTTAVPLRMPATAQDWAWCCHCFARTFTRAGIGPGDRVALAFSFGPYMQFWGSHEGVVEAGAMAIAMGGMDSLQRLETIVDYGATAVVCTPNYALHLAEVAHQRGLDAALETVRVLVCTGEPGGSLTATRARIEELWGARCCDHAGLTEVGPFGLPCPEHGGLHVDEDEFVCEVLDGADEPVAGDQQGELVLTALGRLGCPAIRYRTGDVAVAAGGPCPSGHPGRWLPAGITGRTDDMVVIRGMNVFPSAIEQSLRQVEGGAGEFRLTFYTEPGAMDEVKLEVELSEPVSARRIQERMRRQLGLRVRVVPLRPGVLPRDGAKARRVVDERLALAHGDRRVAG